MNLEAADLPPQVVALIRREVIPRVTKELSKHEAWFEARGHDITRAAIGAVLAGGIPKVAPAGAKGSKTPPPPESFSDLLKDLLEPAVNPIARGAKAELKPILIGLGIGAIVWTSLVFIAGRATKKCPRTAS